MPATAANIAHDLRQFLLEDAPITDLTDNVFRNDVPEGAQLPYVQYRLDRGNDDLTRDGYGDLSQSFFTIDCIAETQGEADDLAQAVKNKLQSINTTARSGSPMVGNCTVRGAFVRDKEDDYTPFPDASDLVIPWSSMSLEIWHVE